MPLLIGEAANRYTDRQKRQRFTEARGEVGEVAVAIEMGLRRGILPQARAEKALALCGRIGAMLTRLVQRFS